MTGLEFSHAYIDDILVISKDTFKNQLNHLEKVLTQLSEARLKVNATKSFFCREELEYVGYWITHDGIRPLSKKVEAISNLAPPKSH
jgi:hypothetical protein